MRHGWLASWLALMVGCADPSPSSAGSGGATTTEAASSSTTRQGSSTSTTQATSTTSTDDGDESDAPGTDFITDPDAGPWPGKCRLIEQNCGKGDKCNAYAADGGDDWNAARCVPVAAAPGSVGDLCVVLGSPASGLDDCDVGLLCWPVDPATLEGRCTPYCAPPASSPACEDPSRRCWIGNDGFLPLCLPVCDPLGPETCPAGLTCRPLDEGTGGICGWEPR